MTNIAIKIYKMQLYWCIIQEKIYKKLRRKGYEEKICNNNSIFCHLFVPF